MHRSKTTLWVIGTIVLAFLIVALAWFFAISPRLESAADMESEEEFERARIDLLEIELAGLERDFRDIETFRGDLEALRVEIPMEAQLADLTRRLNTLAAESGVVIVSVSPTSALAITPPAAEVPVAEAEVASEETGGVIEDSAGTVEGEATETADQEDPVATVSGVAGLYAIPVEIVTLGGYEQSLAFISKLQERDARLLLVSQITATSQEETGAQGGRPALLDGDLELRLGTYAFVLVDTSIPTTGEESEKPRALPVPSGQRNPFIPPTPAATGAEGPTDAGDGEPADSEG